MRLFSTIVFFLAGVCVVSAQPAKVTANVSVTQTAAAGTASFLIQFLDANLSSTIDTPLGVLKDTGLAASHLSEISVALNQGFVVTTYDFTLNLPAEQYAATRDRLIAIQRSMQTTTSQALGWSTSFSASEEEMSKALEQALPALLVSARAKAALLATAIGKTLGEVESVSAPMVNSTGLSLVIGLTASYFVQ
ncbi:MAG: SIMPL domain-containing protein [Acidobacteriia bacterium]|nr:SIMPL domain-containing protein [Terriglobia bacterium]